MDVGNQCGALSVTIKVWGRLVRDPKCLLKQPRATLPSRNETTPNHGACHEGFRDLLLPASNHDAHVVTKPCTSQAPGHVGDAAVVGPFCQPLLGDLFKETTSGGPKPFDAVILLQLFSRADPPHVPQLTLLMFAISLLRAS